jgi:hypothetical protein
MPRDMAWEANPRWKGDTAGYNAMHRRVEQARGKPSQCQRCGKDDPAERYEWANLTDRYEDPDDYQRMCVPCHRAYDAPRQHPNAKRPGRPRQKVKCSECGRKKTHAGRGLCSACYTRARRQGLLATRNAS